MPPESQDNTATHRPIWELDCLSRTVLLTTAFTPEEQADMLRDCVCDCLRMHLDNPGWVLMALSSACRQANRTSTRINRVLNKRFKEAVARAARMPVDAFVNRTLPEDVQKAFPGYLWAMLCDTDAGRQELGAYLVHDWLWRAAQAPRNASDRDGRPSNACCGKCQAAAKSTEALEQRIAEQDEIIDRMLAYIQRTRPQQSSEAFVPNASVCP